MVPSKARLTHRQVCNLADIDTMRAHQWIARGYFEPEGPAPESGVARLYGLDDAMRLCLFARMVRLGISPNVLGAAHNRYILKPHGFKDDQAYLLVWTGPIVHDVDPADQKHNSTIPSDRRRPSALKGQRIRGMAVEDVLQHSIVRRGALQEWLDDPEVEGALVINLDHLEAAVKAVFEANT